MSRAFKGCLCYSLALVILCQVAAWGRAARKALPKGFHPFSSEGNLQQVWNKNAQVWWRCLVVRVCGGAEMNTGSTLRTVLESRLCPMQAHLVWDP